MLRIDFDSVKKGISIEMHLLSDSNLNGVSLAQRERAQSLWVSIEEGRLFHGVPSARKGRLIHGVSTARKGRLFHGVSTARNGRPFNEV